MQLFLAVMALLQTVKQKPNRVTAPGLHAVHIF